MSPPNVAWQRRRLAPLPPGLWLMAGLWAFGILLVGAVMYDLYLFDRLDLGIYNQVAWNMAHGRLFDFSFAPNSYLADHREWLAVLLGPLYWLAPHPLTLLAVQAGAIAAGALIVFRIVAARAANQGLGRTAHRRYGLLAAGLYLAHPTVLWIPLFEFHMLAFALPLLLLLWWQLERRRTAAAVFTVSVLLLLREDLGLAIAGVGGLLLLQRDRSQRRLAWCFIVGGAVWFLAMGALGVWLSPSGAPMFSGLYGWLRTTDPVGILVTVFSPNHLLTILIFLGTVALFPVLRPRWLLPAAPMLLVFLFIPASLFPLLRYHYAAPLLPWLFLATIAGYERAAVWVRQHPPQHWARRQAVHQLLLATLVVSVVASFVWLGPLQSIPGKIQHARAVGRDGHDQAVALPQPADAVMATNGLYPHLTQREQAYSTRQLFLGSQLHTKLPY